MSQQGHVHLGGILMLLFFAVELRLVLPLLKSDLESFGAGTLAVSTPSDSVQPRYAELRRQIAELGSHGSEEINRLPHGERLYGLHARLMRISIPSAPAMPQLKKRKAIAEALAWPEVRERLNGFEKRLIAELFQLTS